MLEKAQRVISRDVFIEILKSHKSRQLPICNKTITCRPQQRTNVRQQ